MNGTPPQCTYKVRCASEEWGVSTCKAILLLQSGKYVRGKWGEGV